MAFTPDFAVTPEAAEQRLRELALSGEACAFWTPNAKHESFLRDLDRPAWKLGEKNIFILRANNRGGKSVLGTLLAGFLAEPFANEWLLKSRFLRDFRRPNRGRIYTTGNAAETTYQDHTRDWLPQGRYRTRKRGQFNSYFRFPGTGSKFDIFTFDRDAMAGESTHLDWAIVDEPLPQKHWSALVSRLTFGGPIFFLFTALEGAGWISTDIENEQRLGKDVFVTQMCAEDCCIEHGIRGHLPHAYIESLKGEFDEDELSARLEGAYLSLAGAIYRQFGVAHIKQEMEKYWLECIASGHYNIVNVVDPHPRKPFAIGWYFLFPNGDVVAVAEFPDDTFPPYRKIKSFDFTTEEYAELIIETEKAFGRPADWRLMDPNMGNSPANAGAETFKQVFAKCGLIYRDPCDEIINGHQAVKSLLGKPSKGVRPSLYFMDICKNHIYGMKNYAWKDDRKAISGISEKPELVNDDFPTLMRYGAMSGFKYYRPGLSKPPKIWLPKTMRGSR
jgi:hypothetical protein